MHRKLALHGRSATQADVDANSCVFFLPNGSEPYLFASPLPLTATITLDDPGLPPVGTSVQIVQAETSHEGEVILGILYAETGEAVCSLSDLAID